MIDMPVSNHKGFSLVEISIVLAVLGLLLAGVITSASQFIENSRISKTRSELKAIREAIIGYSIVKGRLPCPAEVVCVNNRYETDGEEQNSGAASCGSSITEVWGVVPFRTLGVEAKDVWGNYYMYRISENFGNSIGIDTTGEIEVRSSSDTSSSDNLIANNVAAVLLSPGMNRGQSTSSDEAENFVGNCTTPAPSLTTDTVFVSKEYVPAGAAQPEFDDVILWVSPYVIKARLGQAGIFSN